MWLALLPLASAADRYATLHLGVGVPDLLGGSVSLTVARPFELEIGGATAVIYTTLFARAGAALPFYDGRGDDGRGLLLEGLALGGYRYLTQAYWTGDFDRHGAEADLAVELSWWLAPHAALDVQLLGGGGAWIGTQPDGVAVFMDGRATVGFAF
jgi:hypothetical protein